MASLCVVLLHSTDEPALAVAALRAARAAAAKGPCALYVAAEGSRLAARGVAEALSGCGRPDLAAWLREFLASGGRLLASEACLRERGFAPDLLLPAVSLEDDAALGRLASEGWTFVSF
jgi:predicted peroxiredoxin